MYRGYYLGSDGYFYAKCIENARQATYTYTDDTPVLEKKVNSERYFKVEPIKWRVLNTSEETGNKILLAESILISNFPYYGTWDTRTLNDGTIHANNYKYSNIRAYLNGIPNQILTDGGTTTNWDLDYSKKGFLQLAFTESAQALIATTTVDNSEASTNPASNPRQWNNGVNQYVCEDTEDKIFLLSEKEATTEAYGFPKCTNNADGNSRIRGATDYAKANHVYIYTQYGFRSWWWLRSPCHDPNNSYGRRIGYDGLAINYGGVGSGSPDGGVVPALSISANSLP